MAPPCAPWSTEFSCAAMDVDTQEMRDRAAEVSTWVLWGLSGRQFGVSCPVVVRPCVDRCRPCPSWHQPCHLRGGVLLDLGRGGVNVTAVTVDGAALPAEAWTVQDGRWLRRLDGQSWPTRQDYSLPTTDVGTWSVTYTVGVSPPEAGVLAAEVLNCEVLRALRPDDDGRCKLPRRTRTVARSGVTVELIDPATFLVGGKMGLAEVDWFLTIANPSGMSEPPRVWSPDYDSARSLPRA